SRDLPSRIVRGRSGVQMKTNTDGEIEGFSPPPVARLGPPGVSSSKDMQGIMLGVGGTFDLTELVMRMAGQDPYRYERNRLAEVTREERLCRMAEGAERRKRESLFHLKERLEAIDASTMSDVDKRAVVVALWDECAEDSTGRGATTVAQARATIKAFILRA